MIRNRQPVAWNGNGTVAVWADEINEAALNELGSWVECSEAYYDIAPLPVRLIDDRFHCWVPYRMSPNSPYRSIKPDKEE